MYARTDCSSCEHQRWESKWKSRLERARTFLAKLAEGNMPGVDDISSLVTELDEQFHKASWNARDISHTFKKSVARVSVGKHVTGRSPLVQEVRPDDIANPQETEKGWSERDENDYDGNYVASTDPIHPVSTDYSHPIDDDDGSWMFNHFSPEEMEAPIASMVFDQSAWSWDDDDSEASISFAVSQGENTASKIEDQDHIARKPEVEASCMFTNTIMDGLGMREELEKEQVELIIEAFWTVVNNLPGTNQQPPQLTKDLSVLLCKLDISSTTSTSPSASASPFPSSTPVETTANWIDGLSDKRPTPPLTSPTLHQLSPPILPVTPPSPNSTRTAYSKQRKFLKKQLQEDVNKSKYYSDLLLVSRWEVRAFEGPEGRFVPDPPMLRKPEGSNGWFR